MSYRTAIIVENYEEALFRAKELKINSSNFKYCRNESDLLGYKIPSSKQLFVRDEKKLKVSAESRGFSLSY